MRTLKQLQALQRIKGPRRRLPKFAKQFEMNETTDATSNFTSEPHGVTNMRLWNEATLQTESCSQNWNFTRTHQKLL